MNPLDTQLLRSTCLGILRIILEDEDVPKIQSALQDLKVDLNPVKNTFASFCQFLLQVSEIKSAKMFWQIFEMHFAQWVSLIRDIQNLTGVEKPIANLPLITLKDEETPKTTVSSVDAVEKTESSEKNKEPRKISWEKPKPTNIANRIENVTAETKPERPPLSNGFTLRKTAPQNNTGEFSNFKNNEENPKVSQIAVKGERAKKDLVSRPGAIFGDEVEESKDSENALNPKNTLDESEKQKDEEPETKFKTESSVSARLKMFEQPSPAPKPCPPKVPVKPNVFQTQPKPINQVSEPRRPPLPPVPNGTHSSEDRTRRITPPVTSVQISEKPGKLDISKFQNIKIITTPDAKPSDKEPKQEYPYPSSSNASLSDSETGGFEFYSTSGSNYTDYDHAGESFGANNKKKSSSSCQETDSDPVYCEIPVYNEIRTDTYLDGTDYNEDMYEQLPEVDKSGNESDKNSKKKKDKEKKKIMGISQESKKKKKSKGSDE